VAVCCCCCCYLLALRIVAAVNLLQEQVQSDARLAYQLSGGELTLQLQGEDVPTHRQIHICLERGKSGGIQCLMLEGKEAAVVDLLGSASILGSEGSLHMLAESQIVALSPLDGIDPSAIHEDTAFLQTLLKYPLLRHYSEISIVLNIDIPGATAFRVKSEGGAGGTIDSIEPAFNVNVAGMSPGTWVFTVEASSPSSAILARETIMIEVVLTPGEVMMHRRGPDLNPLYPPLATTSSLAGPPVRVLITGNLHVDGQRTIWLQQARFLPRDRFHMDYLIWSDEEGDGLVEGRLASCGVALKREPLPALDLEVLHRSYPDLDLTTKNVVRRFIEAVHEVGGDPEELSRKHSALSEYYRTLYRAFLREAPDVLVLANARSAGSSEGDVVAVTAARYALGSRVRIVLELPNLFPDPLLDVDIVVGPSHFAVHHESMSFFLGPTPRMLVIPPGVNTVAFSPQGPVTCHPGCPAVTGGRGCHEACQVVGFMGRLSREKSVGLFLTAAALVLQSRPFVRFTVIGDGPLLPHLRERAARLGISERVHFVGRVWGEDEMASHLRSMKMIVNPSLQAPSETFCIANIEAMAVGVPIVSFGVGGVGEYLQHGVNGWQVDEATPQALAQAVSMLLADEALRQTLGRGGLQTVSQSFSADLSMQRYSDLYQCAAAQARGESGCW
jgi:glycosyltransferase involved in cell wall biosynthesis